MIPELWSRWFGTYVPFRAEYHAIFCSLHLGQLKVSVVIIINYKHELLR